MKNPNIRTRVVHSQSKSAWNIIGMEVGKRYKIARIPYLITEDTLLNIKDQQEAYNIAEYISYCFNNSNEILKDK